MDAFSWSFLTDTWFLIPCLALFAGVLALVPLGTRVLQRGVVFVDLAVAQAAAAASIWSASLIHHPNMWVSQLLAILGAIVCVYIVAFMAKQWPQQREALIGLIYVACACLAMLGARQDPHGRERLLEMLAADVLWATPIQVLMLAACAISVLILHLRFASLFARDMYFYAVFAIVASIAVPVLGLFLVFVILIAPALWMRRGMSMFMVMLATFIVTDIGLWASWLFDLPSGACVALSLALWGCLSLLHVTKQKKLESPLKSHQFEEANS
jgi:zinc/manganese transport system permease protein